MFGQLCLMLKVNNKIHFVCKQLETRLHAFCVEATDRLAHKIALAGKNLLVIASRYKLL